MTRALIIIGLALALACLAYWQGGGKLRERLLQDQIDTINEAQDAQDACPDSLPWLERLLCHRER